MNPLVLRNDDPRLSQSIDEVLECGGVLIFPTDTVFGIGGNPWDKQVVARVQTMKGRSSQHPFTLHLPTSDLTERFAHLNEQTRKILNDFFPGPFTFLLWATARAPASAVKERKVGIRIPDHPFFTTVMAQLDRPLFGTSVNRSGEPPLNNIDQIIEQFGNRVELIVCESTVSGAPSAIIDLTLGTPRALRGELPQQLSPLAR